jgi:hypothetical protein
MRFGIFTLLQIYAGGHLNHDPGGQRRDAALLQNSWLDLWHAMLLGQNNSQKSGVVTVLTTACGVTQPIVNRDGLENIFVPHIKTMVLNTGYCGMLLRAQRSLFFTVVLLHVFNL